MSDEEHNPSKGAIVRQAVTIAIMVFFFAVVLFIGFVILAAKLATKYNHS